MTKQLSLTDLLSTTLLLTTTLTHVAVSPDTAIAITFGLISIVLSFLSLLVAYLTLKAMSTTTSTYRLHPFP